MAKISSWIKKQRGFDKDKIKENYKSKEYVDIDIFSVSNKSGDSNTENNSDCNSIIEENTINVEDTKRKGENQIINNTYDQENDNKNNDHHEDSEICSIHKNKCNKLYKCILNIFEDNEILENNNKIETNINKQIIEHNKNNIQNNINNILLSKKSHIFHTLKILVPSIHEINRLNGSYDDKYENIKEQTNFKKEVEEAEEKNKNKDNNSDNNNSNYFNTTKCNIDRLDVSSINKDLFEDIYIDTSPNKKELINDNINIEEGYYESIKTSTNYNNVLNICKDDKNKRKMNRENALNNIYTNFDNNVNFDTDNCIEIDMSIHAFICPKSFDKTNVKCYVEISPNMNFNEFFISFITNCITHFIKVCKEFEINEDYNKELQKNIFFYDKLRKAAKEYKIY
ncbi:hypothetical protein PFTANZ_02448 [Plasmodium falciparum Tanzania (2000708)]|uniref:Uncharacterized protein n=1 Tax=Plasmodium falciparum Tanzania (2000708) TaxID=1036725 RepID=A0A024W9K7_PLAFA|nr:hypothetical protein PFTANZ_02448 [Plasmodium falciparum Tanzania (2000708)]